jgi:hypothetical protein
MSSGKPDFADAGTRHTYKIPARGFSRYSNSRNDGIFPGLMS